MFQANADEKMRATRAVRETEKRKERERERTQLHERIHFIGINE